MKLTVERKVLVQMLKVLNGGRVKQDGKLRLAAQGDRVTLTREDLSEAAYDAQVSEEGVCFFRHKQLLPLLNSYKGEKTLSINIGPEGIQIGSTTISRGLWEISLFNDPQAAPPWLYLKGPEIAEPKTEEQQPDLLKEDLFAVAAKGVKSAASPLSKDCR